MFNLILDSWNERQEQIFWSFDNRNVMRHYAEDVFLFIAQQITEDFCVYLCNF